MDLSKLNQIDRNMDQQKRYVAEILEMLADCEKRGIEIEGKELLQSHCKEIEEAAVIAKKAAAELKPIYKAVEDAKKKKAEEEAKKKKASKKKPVEDIEVDDDDDMSFLE